MLCRLWELMGGSQNKYIIYMLPQMSVKYFSWYQNWNSVVHKLLKELIISVHIMSIGWYWVPILSGNTGVQTFLPHLFCIRCGFSFETVRDPPVISVSFVLYDCLVHFVMEVNISMHFIFVAV